MAHSVAARGDVEMVQVSCIECGIVHFIPEYLRSSKERLGGYYHCPNGHSQGWAKSQDKLRIERLEKDLEAQKSEKTRALARANEAEAGEQRALAAATKARASKKKFVKRVQAGVCIHCNRTFKQLAAHMKSKHHEHPEIPDA